MKQAILLTAYRDLEFVNQIVDMFDENYLFYVHLDAKQEYNVYWLETLTQHKRVKRVSYKYDVNWGSIRHLEAILYLIRESLEEEGIEYIHLITGQDFPVKTSADMTSFLTENKGKEFITGSRLPDEKWKGGGLNRIKYYNLYETFDARSFERYFIKALVLIQKLFGVNRKLPQSLPVLHGGTTYWTLSREALEYVIDYLDSNPEIMKRFKYTFCAEEIVIHSILMQDKSPFREKICQNNLRYIVWERRNKQYPANLNDKDYAAIIKSGAFFARKFSMPVSKRLLKKIMENIFDS